VPRIRSIHPGFWTDEAVVSVSRDARLFFIGLWNQCDDRGIFEWKPVGLRLRIFPAEALNVVPLLQELEKVDLIRGYEVNGKRYGAVRNFVIFQRPKKPRNIHPFENSLRLFSGLTKEGSPPVRNQWGNRESEGSRRREEEVPPYTNQESKLDRKGGGSKGGGHTRKSARSHQPSALNGMCEVAAKGRDQ